LIQCRSKFELTQPFKSPEEYPRNFVGDHALSQGPVRIRRIAAMGGDEADPSTQCPRGVWELREKIDGNGESSVEADTRSHRLALFFEVDRGTARDALEEFEGTDGVGLAAEVGISHDGREFAGEFRPPEPFAGP
jgi:hypothetical protein